MLPAQRINRFLIRLINKLMRPYPSPAYHFLVNWGGVSTGFTEISGLSIESEVIEYREGNSPEFSTVKMPGIRKYSNVILMRGIVANDNDFFLWINTIQGSQVQRRDVTISLLNANHEPLRTWKLRNAWPCKVQASDLKADGNEIAIETIELAHEGLSIETT
jgi:phage tail-like protein